MENLNLIPVKGMKEATLGRCRAWTVIQQRTFKYRITLQKSFELEKKAGIQEPSFGLAINC